MYTNPLEAERYNLDSQSRVESGTGPGELLCAGSYHGSVVTPADYPGLFLGGVCVATCSDPISEITERKTALSKQFDIVVDTVELDDINRDKERDIPRYNTSNHWEYENSDRPDDYEDVEDAVTGKYWMQPLKKDYQQFAVNKGDVTALRQAQGAYHLLGRLPEITREDIADIAAKPCYKELRDLLINGSCFVRTDFTSLKCGAHENKVYKQLSEVFESIVSSPRNHSPLGRVNREDTLTLYLIPWIDINPDFEFRVFVNNKVVTAISQQNIYQKNEALCKLSKDERTEKIGGLVQVILDYYDNKIINHVATCVMDMAVMINDSDEMSVYFIELNPFGKDYTSGAAAYSWVEDADKVYGKVGEKTINFRYVV